MTGKTADERRFDYFVSMEGEERGERRGLEQRAAGLIAALLVVFPVAGTVAKDADRHETIAAFGLVFLLIALVIAIYIAVRVVRALAPDDDATAGSVTSNRKEVDTALARGDLKCAAEAQCQLVTSTRAQNNGMVDSIRNATKLLPLALAVLLISLGLIVYSSATGEDQGTPPAAAHDASGK